MTFGPDPVRFRYGRLDALRALCLAAEIQDSARGAAEDRARGALKAPTSEPAARSFTLGELCRLGGEFGLSPREVEEAATLALLRRQNRWAWLMGAPARIRYACRLPGEVSPERLALELEEPANIVDTTDAPNETATDAPRVCEWALTEFPGSVRVCVSSGGGETEIEVEGESNRVAALLVWLAPLGGALLTLMGVAAAGGSPGLRADVLVLAGAIGGFIVARTAWRRIAEDWQGRTASLAERVAERARALATESDVRPGEGANAVATSPDVRFPDARSPHGL